MCIAISAAVCTGFAWAADAQTGDGSVLTRSSEWPISFGDAKGYGRDEAVRAGQNDAFMALFRTMALRPDFPRYSHRQYKTRAGEPIVWYAFWKDTVPAEMPQLLAMVEPRHPLTVMGTHAVAECPATATEAAAIKQDSGIGATYCTDGRNLSVRSSWTDPCYTAEGWCDGFGMGARRGFGQ